MKKLFLLITLLLSGAALYIGCGFTDGYDVSPNDPSGGISAKQFFTDIQVNTYLTLEGQLSRTSAVWTQQMSGTDRQFLALGQYQIDESNWDGEFSSIYAQAGLKDIRNLEQLSAQFGNKRFLGIAQFYEALVIGTAASLWGDIPYSQTLQPTTYPTPILDKQSVIFAGLQTVLDSAIANLTNNKTVNSGLGAGPAESDFSYAGDNAKWIAACHTLKARYYLLWGKKDSTNYAKASAETGMGITTPFSNDLLPYHSGIDGEKALWYQFTVEQRDSYCRMGKYLIDLMKSRKDTVRMKMYASATASGTYVGSDPGDGNTDASTLGALYGSDNSQLPMLSYAENQLIMAECMSSLHGGNNDVGALLALNAYRQALQAHYPGTSYPALVGLTGKPLLDEILTEKYISLFLQIGVYNDWKRTGVPAFTPYLGKEVPRRLIYGQNERNTNPNIPSANAAPKRNENDPQ